jgi:hypothetical protein
VNEPAHGYGFLIREIRDSYHVTFRFDDESPDAERTEAVLNDPSRLPVNHSSGQWNPTTCQIASEASLHRANASSEV